MYDDLRVFPVPGETNDENLKDLGPELPATSRTAVS